MRILSTTICALFVAVMLTYASMVAADSNQDDRRESSPSRESSIKSIAERTQRGKLHDAFQYVRGDSGKWNDAPILQHAPPLSRKPEKVSIDDWADQLVNQQTKLTSNDDNWLLLRTRQLDDNDRVWVERVERQGNEFTVVVNEAIWKGRYSKTFTYYGVFGINLGKLKPGKYQAKWMIQPMEFKQFEGDGRPMDNWPKDERASDKKPTELNVSFTVAGP